jgi:hypothetical protein
MRELSNNQFRRPKDLFGSSSAAPRIRFMSILDAADPSSAAGTRIVESEERDEGTIQTHQSHPELSLRGSRSINAAGYQCTRSRFWMLHADAAKRDR